MSEDFKKIAQNVLNEIFSLIEEDFENFEVDYEEENLKFEDGSMVYFVSIHELTSQIWLSSPKSGAHHFEMKKNKSRIFWVSTRDDSIELFDLIKNELSN